jgi:hypothetical protein
MAKRKFWAIIEIEVDSNLSDDEAVRELSKECAYEIPSTKNVRVVGTEWLETTNSYPQ